MITLKGITWDHARGYEPLKAIGDVWNGQNEVQLSWDVRSLKDFGDYPIEKLIGLYDLIVIDHPYVGSAAVNKLLIPLDKHLPAAFMKLQREQSLGPCFESYRYGGHHWALPVDAAAQVAAWRKDLADALGWTPPASIMELREAAERLPAGKTIAIPLCPTDSWCVFLSLCARHAGPGFFTVTGIDAGVAAWALEQIRSWRPFLHKDSFAMNPVQLLEHMAAEDDIVYTPYTFGYTNYARKGWRKKLVQFRDAPGVGAGRCAPLLGGAGLAVAAGTKHLADCLEVVQFILSKEMQKGLYFREQGQPAHLAAWLDRDNDAACSGFFSDTMETMLHAYVRPRHEGFNRFQEAAADHLHRYATGNPAGGGYATGGETEAAVRQLNKLYQTIQHGEIPAY